MRQLALVLFFVATAVMANDPPSKPIKPLQSKEEASSSVPASTAPKEEVKPIRETKASREAKAAEAAKQKEQQASDELATKIAEKLAAIRKDKPEPIRPSVRPAIRPPHAAYSQKSEPKLAEKAKVVHAVNSAHWSYEGEGDPSSWGKMNPANAKCDSGDRQSPIDIRDGIRVDLDGINFDYKPVAFSVIDNRHTIQVNLSSGNRIQVSGKTFELVQFHFHRPSEERIGGKNFAMVAHLVHKDMEGKLAVIAVLIEPGKSNVVVQTVWNNLPLEKEEVVKAISTIDMTQILPTSRDYYTYMGSLTTPPCSEGVLWMVMKEPIEISSDQHAIFARLYPMNARPIQRTAGRIIKESK
ncbi:MAG: carbonic anhydrase family protein [Undibacterium sp.]|nr:carbonic anhydrase family protein [Undibacterium sp.]